MAKERVKTKAYTTTSGIYISPSASKYTHEPPLTPPRPTSSSQFPAPALTTPSIIKTFHESLPDFNTTPLHDLPQVARQLGISRLLIKAESQRLGLPAFKILGASWGVYKALCDYYGLDPDITVTGFEGLRAQIAKRGGAKVVLFAATEGNHGRAVARMAGLLGLGASIYVPSRMYQSTKKLIESEGATVVAVEGDYEDAAAACWRECQRSSGRESERDEDRGNLPSSSASVGIMVQDNAFLGYEVVPGWIVEGYSTLLREVEEQWAHLLQMDDGARRITHIVTPIGVGSLGHAVVKWAKSSLERKVKVIAVEPQTAGCLYESLKVGESKTIETVDTIMSGMCCGIVSPISWPVLRDGVDCSVTVDDWTCHETVVELQGLGVDAGPCGAGCLAGLRKVLDDEDAKEMLGLDGDSVVVVLSTEGKREYPVPKKMAGNV